jgi:hypothetical protein
MGHRDQKVFATNDMPCLALWIFRATLFARGCCSVLERLFDWGSHGRVAAVTSLHPYVELFADATAVAVFLALLANLWFFRRWARVLFVLFLGLALVYCAIEPRHSTSASLPPSWVLAITGLMVMLNGVIVTMFFLSPVRDKFADEI